MSGGAGPEQQAKMFAAIAQAHRPEINACATAGSKEIPRGELQLTFSIRDDRRAELRVGRSSLPKTVQECIVEVAGRWTFPTPFAGLEFEHTYALPM
jgi:hypothetical protein